MKTSIGAARVAIAAVITYQLLLLLLIFLRPDLDPTWHTISEWVIGPFGFLMTLAFFVSALSYAALFIAIKSQPKGVWGKIGLGLLVLCIIGTIGVGTFVTDPVDGSVQTTRGMLHTIFGSSALMLLPFSALLININLARKNPAWRSAKQILFVTAFVPLLGFLGFMIYTIMFVVPLGPTAYGPGVNIGLPPRFMLLTYMVWIITLAWQAIKIYGKNKQS